MSRQKARSPNADSGHFPITGEEPGTQIVSLCLRFFVCPRFFASHASDPHGPSLRLDRLLEEPVGAGGEFHAAGEALEALAVVLTEGEGLVLLLAGEVVEDGVE